MGGEVKFLLAQNPYIKLVLHALKHKVSSVNGILIGRLDDASSTVDIVDAVPLSHSQIGLLPTLEIALIQVEEFFSADGLSVVGYFHANERYDDSELGKIPKKIGDHISRYFPQPAVLLLDNKKLEALWKGIHLEPVMQQLYTKDASKGWRQAGIDASVQLTLREPSANTVLWDFIATEKYEEVVDFDDYLDDISRDWLNPGLFE
ncbi:unnamed protein product [Victoria cruziana]